MRKLEVGFGNKKVDEIHCSSFFPSKYLTDHHSVVVEWLEIGL